MFKWLTRRDGARMARAKRRLRSPRGSVFTEFAIVMPIVLMVCSALIEVVGLWDAQVMANHAAWTVGRIVMVRGSDGLEFSSTISKKSKTGIEGSELPDALKKALASLDTAIHGANLFNNRGNIATLFLMSTCGIGYYGKSPGKTLDDGFKALVEAGVKALTEGIPGAIKDMVADFTLPDIISGGGAMGEVVKKIIDKVVNEVVKALMEPLAKKMQELLQAAFDKIFGEGGAKIDDFFNGDGEAAWHARQMFGAAQRIARAKSTIKTEVLTVTDMASQRSVFLFAKKSVMGRLAYPQCVDSDAKSDGYFVKNPSGWPPNDNGLAMTHVEINWPYESGWLFPVVSGRSTPAESMSSPPVARGHSMVFPQPNIANDNLYSEGASAFEPGSYTNNANAKAMEDLANEMKDYLRCVRFCMKYRICEETLTLQDEGTWIESWTWKRCKELKEIFKIGDGKGGGDYAKCWSAITDGKDQDALMRNLEGYFKTSSYRNREYFYWDNRRNAENREVAHYRYGTDICNVNGNLGLGLWYGASKGLTYADSSVNKYKRSVGRQASFLKAYKACLESGKLTAEEKDWLRKRKHSDMYEKVVNFADSAKVNVHNIVKWIEGHDLEAWKSQDKSVEEAAKKADASFAYITKLIHDELRDIDNILDDKAEYTGDPDDPVLDPDDADAMKDPEKAAEKARDKWNTMKANLRKKLAEVEDAAVELRNLWAAYKKEVSDFVGKREDCVAYSFEEGCICALARAGTMAILDNGGARFKIPAGLFPYDIGKGTRDMLDRIAAYQKAVNKSYNLEVEYGAMLGLESAGKAKRDGRSPDEIIDGGGAIDEDTPGSMSSGSDSGKIIDKDHQSYQGGAWKWD